MWTLSNDCRISLIGPLVLTPPTSFAKLYRRGFFKPLRGGGGGVKNGQYGNVDHYADLMKSCTVQYNKTYSAAKL